MRPLCIVCCVKFPQNINKTSNYVLKVEIKNARLIFSKLTAENGIKSAHVHLGQKYSRMDQVKICGEQPLKILKGHGLPKADHTPSEFLEAVSHKFYLV